MVRMPIIRFHCVKKILIMGFSYDFLIQTKNYLAVFKKLHFCYMFPHKNVLTLGGKYHKMRFICVVTASYTLGFLMTKSPGLVFRMKHKISKQTKLFFGIFIVWKRRLLKYFIVWKNAYQAFFKYVFFGP